MRVIDGEVAAPSPGWWVCPSCARRHDRDGDRVLIRVCAGQFGALHLPVSMRVEGSS